MKKLVFIALFLKVSLLANSISKEDLGKTLFFDVNLSKNRTQSCATCHNPEAGFIDDRENGVSKIRNFFIQDKRVKPEFVDAIVEDILDMASTHPLITKISRASVYVALDGNNPIASSKAIGASRWSDVNIIIEPTVAILQIPVILTT